MKATQRVLKGFLHLPLKGGGTGNAAMARKG